MSEGHTEKLALHVGWPPRPTVDTLSVAVRVRERVDVGEGVAGTDRVAFWEPLVVGVIPEAEAEPEMEWDVDGERDSMPDLEGVGDSDGERVDDAEAEKEAVVDAERVSRWPDGEIEVETGAEREPEAEPEGERLNALEALSTELWDGEPETEAQGVSEVEWRGLRVSLAGAVALDEAEGHADALRDGGVDRDSVGLGVSVFDGAAERDTEGQLDSERLPTGDADTAPLRDPVGVEEELRLTTGEALGEGVTAGTVREGSTERVTVALRTGVTVDDFEGNVLLERERVAQPVLVAEAHPVRDREKLGDAVSGLLPEWLPLEHGELEREREGEAEELGQRLLVPDFESAAVALAEGVMDCELEVHALTEGEGVTEAEPHAVRVNTLVLGMALCDAHPDSERLTVLVTEKDREPLGEVVNVALPGVRVSEGLVDADALTEAHAEPEPDAVLVLVLELVLEDVAELE